MSDLSSTDRTPLLYTYSDVDHSPSSSAFTSSSSPQHSNGPGHPLSPPYHHTALAFHQPHHSSLHPFFHTPPTSSRSCRLYFTSRALITIFVCLALALVVLVSCHMLTPSTAGLFAALSRMRPHFGHSSQLLHAAYAPNASPSGMRAMLSLDRGTTDAQRQQQLGIVDAYLSASEGRFAPPPNSASSPSGLLVTATRFCCTKESDLAHLSAFLSSASRYSDAVLIALNLEADRCSTAEWLKREGWGQSVHVVPVVPWISVTAGLNALLLYASHLSFTRILYQSVEVTASVAAVDSLLSHLDAHTLVVGACLAPYQSCPSIAPHPAAAFTVINGVNNPWNTLAAWHVPSLLKTGFLMVSDSGAEGGEEGQEEGPTIALLQWMARRWEDRTELTSAADDSVAAAMRCEAKLITLPQGAVQWAAVEGSERQAYVERKLRSKRERYEAQMERLGIEKGVVRFIVEESAHGAVAQAAPVAEAAASRRPITIGHR